MKAIKALFRGLGVDLRRYRKINDQDARLAAYLHEHAVDCLLDVGANTGQFARAIRAAGYKEKIVSFEALPAAHAALSQVAEADPKWVVAPRMAVSDQTGTVEFHVSENLVSSSLMAPSTSLTEEGIEFENNAAVEVLMQPLATILDTLGVTERTLFLKMDVQGAEMEVLGGAKPILDRVVGILSEMSTATLYEGQQTYQNMDTAIRSEGYDLWDLENGFRSAGTMRLLQFDATYFRNAT